MEYDFDTVKRLYDKYGISVDPKTNTYCITDRKDGKSYSFEGLGAEKVKFAHYWVYATKYGQSTSSPNNSNITEEEYARAFSEDLREVYNTIIGTAIQHLQTIGRMCKVEALKNELSEAIYAHAQDVAEGLYSKPNGYAAFETWCREVAKVYTPEEWVSNNKSR